MIGLILQARSNSTRFPGKITADLGGKPMLAHVMQRCAAAQAPEIRVLAMPGNDPLITGPQNKGRKTRVLDKLCEENGFELFAPDTFGNKGVEPDDVLGRFYRAALRHKIDVIIRITGDCPLIDPALIDICMSNYGVNRNSSEYATNTMMRVHPRGMDVEIFSFNALEESWKAEAAPPELREYDALHVTTHIRRNPKRFNHQDIQHPHLRNKKHRDLRLTVDYPEDLKLVNEIHKTCKGQVHWEEMPEEISKENPNFPKGMYPMYGLMNILAAYDKHPTWANINGRIRQAG